HKKAPEYHPIYGKMDAKVEKQLQKERIEYLENELELSGRGMVDESTSRSALPKEVKKKHPYNPADIRVMGLSFTDYAEHKFLGSDGIHDPWMQKMGVNVPKNYSPHMSQVPINVKGQVGSEKPLVITKYTAADYKKMGTVVMDDSPDIFTGAVKKLERKIIWPKYYQNPYQYQDYVYLQDIYANTIAGRIFDTIGFFALANGIKPKLRVRNEGSFKTDEEKQKALLEHKWMIDTLEEIERNISTSSSVTAFGKGPSDTGSEYPIGPIATAESPSTPTYDTPLQKKWFAAFINTQMFGREIIVPRIDKDDNKVKLIEDGEKIEYKNIPKIMLVIHPRDIGFNYVDYMTHRLLGIQLNNSNWILRPDEMIFWENLPDNPVYGAKFYGMSGAQSMMGSARTLRRIIEVDFPLIAKTRWSGMYWLVFKRKGEQTGTSDNELRQILSNIELNGINATLEENPKEDFMLHKIDLDPKISELLQMVKDLVLYMMGQVGMPQGLLYGEQDLNRDTLKTSIASWTKGKLKKFREPFLETVTNQWYRRLTKTLEEQSEKWKEAMEIFEVVATVDEFKLDDRETLINTLMMLENLTGKWLVKAESEFLEMPDLQQNIDPNAKPEDVPPMPSGKGGGFNVTDKSSGKQFGVSSTN
ncbi:MAG: hypothetical protein IIC67_02800, partial [Thaumarchaeota archaeon]|nr:hypothetical protein [Nitrososphaerota archaeon]